jgi:hypothetical protein
MATTTSVKYLIISESNQLLFESKSPEKAALFALEVIKQPVYFVEYVHRRREGWLVNRRVKIRVTG